MSKTFEFHRKAKPTVRSTTNVIMSGRNTECDCVYVCGASDCQNTTAKNERPLTDAIGIQSRITIWIPHDYEIKSRRRGLLNDEDALLSLATSSAVLCLLCFSECFCCAKFRLRFATRRFLWRDAMHNAELRTMLWKDVLRPSVRLSCSYIVLFHTL